MCVPDVLRRHCELQALRTHRHAHRRVVAALPDDLHAIERVEQRLTRNGEPVGIPARDELLIVREVAFDQPGGHFGARRTEHHVAVSQHDFDLPVAGQALHLGQALRGYQHALALAEHAHTLQIANRQAV